MRIDGFDQIARVGSGGLGEVYRARRTSTGTTVAIKALHSAGSLDTRERRVRRELTALASLRGHAHVINLEEVIRADDELLLVMEYSPGGSLDDRSRAFDGLLPLAEVVLVGQHTAAALAAAHAAGIVHRDIKPQNLLVGAYGAVKVCDFGIAAVADDAGTTTDAVSYRYASPEELRGDATITSAVDVYSLGVTLAKLLTNRYFTHETAVHLGDPAVTPSRPRADGSESADEAERELRALLQQCLRRRADQRPSAAEALAELTRVSTLLGDQRIESLEHVDLPTRLEEPIDVEPPPADRRRAVRAAWLAAAGIWVGVIALAAAVLS